MQIQVYSGRHVPSKAAELRHPYVRLFQDNWDDFGYKARFVAELVMSERETVELGGVRIASANKGYRVSKLPQVLEGLDRNAASLGDSIAYYRRLGHQIPKRTRTAYLRAMGDLVADPAKRQGLEDAEIWKASLLRESAARHALARGGVYIGAPCEEVSPPEFDFSMQIAGGAMPHSVSIDFSEQGGIPHRKMLFIGRNGTGKTRTLAGLATALMPKGVLAPETVKDAVKTDTLAHLQISRVIAISYNAFDEFPLPASSKRDAPKTGAEYRSKQSYKYCGLRTEAGTVSMDEISAMLDAALEPVTESDREEVLQRVLTTLLGDALASALCGTREERTGAVPLLSAGQRLVAAIFCNIVGFIEEGSILLIDEPETHLHPGLLTSVAVALDDVLHEYDSFAILATHSPILLQQVPSQFVRVFARSNDTTRVLPLHFESFGEDIGELSRKVLGLADPERDFTHILDRLYVRNGSAEAVEALFAHPLGLPAKAHLYSLEDGSVDPASSEAA